MPVFPAQFSIQPVLDFLAVLFFFLVLLACLACLAVRLLFLFFLCVLRVLRVPAFDLQRTRLIRAPRRVSFSSIRS